MKKTTTPTLFDSQRAPAPTWPTQGNPVFECKRPLPLERVTVFNDDDEFAEPVETPPGVHHMHCRHYSHTQDTRFCPDCRYCETCREARRRGLVAQA